MTKGRKGLKEDIGGGRRRQAWRWMAKKKKKRAGESNISDNLAHLALSLRNSLTLFLPALFPLLQKTCSRSRMFRAW